MLSMLRNSDGETAPGKVVIMTEGTLKIVFFTPYDVFYPDCLANGVDREENMRQQNEAADIESTFDISRPAHWSYLLAIGLGKELSWRTDVGCRLPEGPRDLRKRKANINRAQRKGLYIAQETQINSEDSLFCTIQIK